MLHSTILFMSLLLNFVCACSESCCDKFEKNVSCAITDLNLARSGKILYFSGPSNWIGQEQPIIYCFCYDLNMPIICSVSKPSHSSATHFTCNSLTFIALNWSIHPSLGHPYTLCCKEMKRYHACLDNMPHHKAEGFRRQGMYDLAQGIGQKLDSLDSQTSQVLHSASWPDWWRGGSQQRNDDVATSTTHIKQVMVACFSSVDSSHLNTSSMKLTQLEKNVNSILSAMSSFTDTSNICYPKYFEEKAKT